LTIPIARSFVNKTGFCKLLQRFDDRQTKISLPVPSIVMAPPPAFRIVGIALAFERSCEARIGKITPPLSQVMY
jgi:hypothetical protein